MSQRIAFFDLDKTVLAKNSASGWLRREVRLGHLSRLKAVRSAGWVIAYQAGLARIEGAIYSAISTLEGLEEEVLRQRTWEFWEEEARAMVRPGAVDALARHRDQGDLLVLLSSTTSYLAEIVVDVLQLDDWLANTMEVVDGCFTGRSALDPLCYGAGKVVYAEAFAQERGIDLTDCTFYSDSFSDLPVLEMVGEPVLIEPDPRLARIGRRRGWRVEDWGP